MGSEIPVLPRISDYSHWHAQRTPGADALVLGRRRISYAELAERVDTLARALLASGIAKGDRIATLQTPHPDYFVAFLATVSVGAIWVGLDPKYQWSELASIIDDVQPALLFARTEISGRSYAGEI